MSNTIQLKIWAIVIACGINLANSAAQQRPNIIFLLADDLGWGDLSCYGNAKIATPNIDALAQRGTLFTHYYQSSPVCSPSRTGLMTGRFPASLRVHTALENQPAGNREKGCVDFLDPNTPTVTRLLQENGYVTAHFGKWHLGATADAPPPSTYGISVERTGNSNTTNKLPKADRSASSKTIIDEVIQFVEAYKAEPFYVNSWFFDVHAILEPSQEQLDAVKHLGISDRVPFYSPAQIYYGTLRELDIQVGRLVKKLEELGLLDNTLVIFSSDNGPEDIDVINASHSGVGSAGPFRGRKRSLYEGGIRVPFIVSWPGHVPTGRVDEENIIGGVDFLPTICAIAGVSVPQDQAFDGEDRSACLFGETAARRKPLFWEWRYGVPGHLMHKSPTLSVRDGRWVFLMNHDGSRRELYDIVADPMEMSNLADQQADIAQKLAAQLAHWQRSLPPTKDIKTAGKRIYPWPEGMGKVSNTSYDQ